MQIVAEKATNGLARGVLQMLHTSVVGFREQKKAQWMEVWEATVGMRFSGSIRVYFKNFYYDKFQTHAKAERIVK